MQKIVINRCYGGFSISAACAKRMTELGHDVAEGYQGSRSNPALVQAVEELGEDADGSLSNLIVVEIPDGVDWQIEEYDGFEWVAEKHRTWP